MKSRITLVIIVVGLSQQVNGNEIISDPGSNAGPVPIYVVSTPKDEAVANEPVNQVEFPRTSPYGTTYGLTPVPVTVLVGQGIVRSIPELIVPTGPSFVI